jgi:hypothetical protein
MIVRISQLFLSFLFDDNFSTILSAIRGGRVVWNNLRKVLLVNTPINNAQGTVRYSGTPM